MAVVKRKRKTERSPPVIETPKKKRLIKPVAHANGKVSTKEVATEVITASKTPTARGYILRVLTKGLASRAEVKNKAKALARTEGANVSFRTFDVGFFITYLKDKKGYKIVDDGERVKAIPPKS